mmetsp:Transcript_7482/g.15927  ORF Transcript_7482/g.15927 Transcript_7482/m.15927 type:complete len:128 (-) Transcript_7482:265-648(-)
MSANDVVEEVVTAASEAATEVKTAVEDAAKETTEAAKGAVKETGDKAKDAAKDVGEKAKGAIDGASEAVGEKVTAVTGNISKDDLKQHKEVIMGVVGTAIAIAAVFVLFAVLPGSKKHYRELEEENK